MRWLALSLPLLCLAASAPARAAAPDAGAVPSNVATDAAWLRQYLASDSYYRNWDQPRHGADFDRANALLQSPGVLQVFTPAELLDTIFRQTNDRVNDDISPIRYAVVAALNRRWPHDPAVLARYGQQLAKGADGGAAAFDLAVVAPDIWDDSFIPSLVFVIQRTGRDNGITSAAALELLDAHYPAWAKDAAAYGPRLYGAFFENGNVATTSRSQRYRALPSLASPDSGAKSEWLTEVEVLALTHDASAIALLRPFLADKTVVQDDFRPANATTPAKVPLRACDLAHDAILHLLHEPGEFGTLAFNPRDPNLTGYFAGLGTTMGAEGLFLFRARDPTKLLLLPGESTATVWAKWDAAIAALPKRLDAQPVAAPAPPNPIKPGA